MKKRVAAVLLIFVICLALVPLMSGCKATERYTLNEAGDGYVLSYSGVPTAIGGEFEIPAYYGEGEDRLPVTEIAESGLAGFQVTKLTIPATVKRLGAACFSYCINLTEVEFKEGSGLSEISRGAFGYCNSLRKINIPQTVTSVEGVAFCDCSSLTDIRLPSGVTKIGERAFENCLSLAKLDLPEGLVTIGEMAFYRSGLESITIPDSVHDITALGLNADGTEKKDDKGNTVYKTTYGVGMAAFHTCTSLKSVTLGAGMGAVCSGAFGYCTALEKIYIPSGITKIEGAITYDGGKVECGHAFHNDAALTDIYYSGTAEQWEQLKKNTENTLIEYNGAKFDNSAILKATVHLQ